MAKFGWSIDTVATILGKKTTTVRQWRSRSGSVIPENLIDELERIPYSAVNGQRWALVEGGLPVPCMENVDIVLSDSLWMCIGRIHEFGCPGGCIRPGRDTKCASVSEVVRHARDSGLIMSHSECTSLLHALRAHGAPLPRSAAS